MDKFVLIIKEKLRIKVFEPFEDVSQPIPSIVKVIASKENIWNV